MPTVLIRDSLTTGPGDGVYELEFPSEEMTVRELIRERVYQEVQDHNLARRERRMLVQPEEEEQVRNGQPGPRRQIDWKRQFEIACDAFNRRGFMLLVGETHVTSLDDTVRLQRGVEVTFLKLVPLVGG
ncbi:MAG TPA: hypothetical protein VK157_14785 [Phycisphaerales bacterium]|nr:hypothetical protein [Phycisphaerales bacterium]